MLQPSQGRRKLSARNARRLKRQNRAFAKRCSFKSIQAAIKKHYKKRKMPKPEQMEKIAKAWAPYRSVACWYLWRSLDNEP